MNNSTVNARTKYAIYDIRHNKYFKGYFDGDILIYMYWVDDPIKCTHFDTPEKALDYIKDIKEMERNHELVLCACKLNLTCETILNF